MSVYLWNILDPRGTSQLDTWARDQRLTAADRAALNSKLDLLTQLGFDYAVEVGLLRGPLALDPSIYKLRAASASRTFLLFLCPGPLEPDSSTILSAALEVDGSMNPTTSLKDAKAAREALIIDPERRVVHERF